MFLDCSETLLSFASPAMCVSSLHKSEYAFSKSKAILGSIGPVGRSRVSDLMTDDPETPPTPVQRVALMIWQKACNEDP